MNKKRNSQKRKLGLVLLSLLVTASCKTVVRENIISSVNTGVGVSLAENPKTELYEVKVGFIRSQFYSVPTGKKVEGTNQANAADVTPEVVSGIRVTTDARHLFLGADVAENFAVGKIAVLSPAAVAMYVAEAKSTNAAAAAADAAKATSESLKKIPATPDEARKARAPLRLAFLDLPAKANHFDQAARSQKYADFQSFLANQPQTPTLEQIENVRKKLEEDPAIKAKLEEIDRIRKTD